MKRLLFSKPVKSIFCTLAYQFEQKREMSAHIFHIIVQNGICKGMAKHLPGVLLGGHQAVHHPWRIAEHRCLAVAAVEDAHHGASGLTDEDLARDKFARPFILVESEAHMAPQTNEEEEQGRLERPFGKRHVIDALHKHEVVGKAYRMATAMECLKSDGV